MRKLIVNIGLGSLTRGFSQVTTLVMAMVAARILGRADFGLYAMAMVLVVILQALMYCGVYDFIVTDRTDDDIGDTCFWLNFGFSLAGAVVICAAAPVLGHLAHSDVILDLMLALAPSALLASFASWQEAFLLRAERLQAYYRVSVASEAVAFAVALGLLLAGWGLWSFVVYRYLQTILNIVFYARLVRRLPRLAWNTAVAKKAFGFSGNLYVSKIIDTFSNSGADLLIGMFVSPAAAGGYRLASRIVVGISAIAYQSGARLGWIRFAAAANETTRLRAEWSQLILILSVVVWPALAALALLGPQVLPILMGPGWDDAAIIVALLAMARMIGLFDVLCEALLAVAQRAKLVLRLRAFNSLASIGLLFALSAWGAPGAACAQLIAAAAGGVIALKLCLGVTATPVRHLLAIVAPGLIGALSAAAGAALVIQLSNGGLPPLARLALALGGAGIAWSVTIGALLLGRRKRLARAYAGSLDARAGSAG